MHEHFSSTISSRAEPSTTFDVKFEPSRAEGLSSRAAQKLLDGNSNVDLGCADWSAYWQGSIRRKNEITKKVFSILVSFFRRAGMESGQSANSCVGGLSVPEAGRDQNAKLRAFWRKWHPSTTRCETHSSEMPPSYYNVWFWLEH